MIEKPFVAPNILRLFMLRQLPEESQRVERTLRRFFAADQLSFRGNGIRGQPKSNRRDTRRAWRRPAVRGETGAAISGFEKKIEGADLQRIEKGIPNDCWRNRWRVLFFFIASGCDDNKKQYYGEEIR